MLHRAMLASIFVLIAAPCFAQDVLVRHFEVFVEHRKQNIVEKTVSELNTTQGKALVSAVSTYVGIDPTVTSIAISAVAQRIGSFAQESKGLIQTPVGYTVCYALPSNPHAGAGDKGIETHGDSTFNGTIVRVIPGYNFDGLAWYMFVPNAAGHDSRVTTAFDVVAVKADPGWQNRYKNCEPTGEHAWLARNNGTRVNVSCSRAEGVWCPAKP